MIIQIINLWFLKFRQGKLRKNMYISWIWHQNFWKALYFKYLIFLFNKDHRKKLLNSNTIHKISTSLQAIFKFKEYNREIIINLRKSRSLVGIFVRLKESKFHGKITIKRKKWIEVSLFLLRKKKRLELTIFSMRIFC